MKCKKLSCLSGAAAGVWFALAVVPILVFADVPLHFNYQVLLRDSNRPPVSDDDYDMVFTIYNVPTGGVPLWNEAQTVTVTNGVYSVILGQPGNHLDPVDFDGDLYLGVTVESSISYKRLPILKDDSAPKISNDAL